MFCVPQEEISDLAALQMRIADLQTAELVHCTVILSLSCKQRVCFYFCVLSRERVNVQRAVIG